MELWWKRNDIALGDDERANVEDYTGRIPLLLHSCVVNGKIDLDTAFFRDIYNEAVTFEQNILSQSNPSDWRKYATLVLPPQHR
jgi:hypothetical protein